MAFSISQLTSHLLEPTGPDASSLAALLNQEVQRTKNKQKQPDKISLFKSPKRVQSRSFKVFSDIHILCWLFYSQLAAQR